MRAILHHLEHTTKLSFLIADSNIGYIDEKVGLINPKLGLILFSTPQLINYLPNDMCTFSWMTIHYFTPNHIFTAWKNTMVCI